MPLRLGVERSPVFAAAGSAGGGTREAEEPAERYMPLHYAVGDRDGHLLENINHADDAPPEPIASIPLSPDEAFSFSPVRSRIDAILTPFGMSNVPSHAWEFKNGVVHEFATADENPEGFHDPDLFWASLHDQQLPK